jgi:hypothetical protein
MTSTTEQPTVRAAETPSWWERQGDLIMRRPFNEWTFTHMSWLMPAERVTRGETHLPLPVNAHPLDLTYRFDDRDHSLSELHRRTFTTAFVVLHRGEIVHESYPGAFAGPRTRMQLFSISKSATSMLVGIALADGAIGSIKDPEHFPDLDGDDLADRLIRNASRATAGIGAVGGGVATLEWVATPTLLSVPVLLAAETVAVVAVELKLIGELHEVYGQPIKGNTGERASALLHAWSGQRGVNPLLPGVGIASILGTASRRELQNTLLRRFGRNLTALGPFLTGAAVASYLNRRATRNLGEKVQKDLRKKRPEITSEQSEDE